ncbi:tRNA (5-methylaminomethyl-2-thiouridylate)-methyltransferase [Desulfacinum hydrothermale DSM 13146]|uniref:tRNA-specific 2-thiouridylase MnmA n=1 Tax=Desulfacinum hydrothermale DSM 13146 TaxID=1121390 RepID=A0A1W1X526_9BACT|nr:tRNA 2-thiouridine(34) synthase MnmA [Desulfacinum hydrothermale]SMC18828.1 tRNA (5-methylaminomethyl-2-thiouridylate)-methyltransferase [Desulfacinum hydrothermale DSM 13146]
MIIAVALSGGADSLRAAWMLKKAGHRVFALHMRLLPPTEPNMEGAPRPAEAPAVVVELARRLGIPLRVVDLSDDFERRVIRPFVEAYGRGRTPNPCVLCNPSIKFGKLLETARRLGAECLATGHYVRKLDPLQCGGRFGLRRSSDSTKDQSYFLYGLTQQQLEHALFPLADETKAATHAWTVREGFADILAEESQEICFIPSGDYRQFLLDRLGDQAPPAGGPILGPNGEVLGRHKGLFCYTVGQRRGLNLPSTAPWYVTRLDPARNAVWVGRADELLCQEALVRRVNWVSIAPIASPRKALVRVRNQHAPAPARLVPLSATEVRVRFDTPQRAVTPGQAAVFYDDDLLLGGGTIGDRED